MTSQPTRRSRKPDQPMPGSPKPDQQVPGRPTARRPKPAPRATRRPEPGPRAARRPVPDQPRPGPAPSHFANRSNWSGWAGDARRRMLTVLIAAAGLARAAGRWGLAAATGEAGRRAGRAALLVVTLAVAVVALYDQAEVPRAAARPALAAPAARPAAGQGAARTKDPGDRGGLRGRTRPAQVGERPAEVAVAWYAARSGVPRARVKPLQQDHLSAGEVRVLVLADHGHGRLDTALVRLRRGPDGWSVR